MISSDSIKFRFRYLRLSVSLLISAVTVFSVFGQTATKNNPYAPSPEGNARDKQIRSTTPSGPTNAIFIAQGQNAENRPTIARATFKITENTKKDALPPTEIYKVGGGDVLFVSLRNSTEGSRYCTVQPDGTIDFPLAGENLVVAGQTVNDIEKIVASGITLFADPQVKVTVREYASHKITVFGFVENPGEKSLQREAIPLFVIRSEAVVSLKATKAVIKRAPLLKPETYDLRSAETDDVLIFPGNSVEFTVDPNSSSRSYYIAGETTSAGQRELTNGLTLYQAVVASGGVKANLRKVTIRRKTENGLLENTEYDLRAIKAGKIADPVLEAGDVIEIGK